VNILKRRGCLSTIKNYYEYHILDKYGGIFIDMDMICLKPFDELVRRYKFFAGLEPNFYWSLEPPINAGIIGSAPNSPILKRII